MKAANLSEGEIVEAIPILKPSQITAVMESVDKLQFTSMNLLPYMEADVKELVGVLLDEGRDCTSCLPFLGAQGVKELMSRYARG